MSEQPAIRLRLLDSFALTCDQRDVSLPMSARKLLAFLALHERPVQRVYAASTLWINLREDRAFANLRDALWRLRRTGLKVVEKRVECLALDTNVDVDLQAARAAARRVLGGNGSSSVAIASLAGELLPDWYDDWLLIERERFHQLRLHALEALAEQHMEAGRLADALEAGLAAIVGDPLRESAHRLLVRVHLAEGNTAEALRQYYFYRRLILERLGLEPTGQMDALVRCLCDLQVDSTAAA